MNGAGISHGTVTTNSIVILQSTISGNTLLGQNSVGGGIYATPAGDASVSISFSTVVNNSSTSGAGGVAVDTTQSFIVMLNSILANNTGPHDNFQDISPSPQSSSSVSYSLFGDLLSEVSAGDTSTAIYSNSPQLDNLQSNGGTTKTHKPNINSPAINAGTYTVSQQQIFNFTNDQRGFGYARVQDGTIDIGAHEYQNISGGVKIPQSKEELLTRRDMAREMLKKLEGSSYSPPAAAGNVYDDVSMTSINADWIEDFASRGFTEGCAANMYCPDMIVTRASMAKIFLKVKKGTAYTAPPAQGAFFADVSLASDFNIDWINVLHFDIGNSYTEGCGEDASNNLLFCPKEPVSRKWFNSLLNALP